MAAKSRFHEGEIAVQERAGVARAARVTAGVLDDHIPDGALSFVARQTMAAFGSCDAQGNVWASLAFGPPGFLRAESKRRLVWRPKDCHTASGDPLWDNLENDSRVGILLIELTTRRRLRINGRARRKADGDWWIEVERAYANCPKYIQARRLRICETERSNVPEQFRQGSRLNAAQQAWIAHADTFFVASAHPEQGLDASHRGGRPGFVQVLSPHRLRVPDYLGNNMFNTLGNFASFPHAGLAFLDFERNRILQLSGRPEVSCDDPDAAGRTGGTARFWEFEVESWRESKLALELGWQFMSYSPLLPESGDHADATLTFRVQNAWRETDRIRGFELIATNGGLLPPFEAGAHLPIRVRDRSGTWVERHYSLLSDPADRQRYRIGVLAEPRGRGGSLYLHETVRVGDTLLAGPPANGFPLEIDAAHSILVAGGIGITPLLSMLHVLRANGKSFELHYSVKYRNGQAFRQDVENLAGPHAHFYVSKEPGAPLLDLRAVLAKPRPLTHVYVCGPRPMIVAVRELGATLGWAPEQIHFESFGGAASPEDQGLNITLARSGREFHVPAGRSILDVLLENGIAVSHDCRRGECSQCVARILAGEPEHRDLCLSADERAVSMCVCVSRARSDNLTLDL